MKKYIVQFFDKLEGSFDNKDHGWSARKLSSFALTICVFYLHYKYVNFDNSAEFLLYDLIGIFLLLGVITAEQIIKFTSVKSGKPTEETNEK